MIPDQHFIVTCWALKSRLEAVGAGWVLWLYFMNLAKSIFGGTAGISDLLTIYSVDQAISMLESQCQKNYVALNIQHMTFHTTLCFTLVIHSFFYSRYFTVFRELTSIIFSMGRAREVYQLHDIENGLGF